MPSGEQFYGLGLVLGKPLSYRGQTRTLHNARTGFSTGDMTDMAVPLMLSSKGYGIFVDNTFQQTWDFTQASTTQWSALVTAGELNYYFIAANNPADALNRYTQNYWHGARARLRCAGLHAVPLRLPQLVADDRRAHRVSHE